MSSAMTRGYFIIPCECGSTDAYWHGHGSRWYGCEVCWALTANACCGECEDAKVTLRVPALRVED